MQTQMTLRSAADGTDLRAASKVHCEPKKNTKTFLSYLPQNPVDSDNIWCTLS